jgi:bifunctional non-homologous end joining protein LigD
MAARAELRIGEHTLSVSNLEKVLYPQVGFTKANVIDYYARISGVLLPHLEDRPLTLKRYPNGVDGEYFYEKKCPASRPAWIKTTAVWSAHNNDHIHYCTIDSVASLVWAANLADLELHTFMARAPQVLRPTMVVFDLDPGPPADIVACCRVGLWLRDLLLELGLACYPKTSGSKGLQVYVPFNLPKLTYEQTKPFARQIAEHFAAAHPALVVSDMKKAVRTGRVLVDWSQNDDHKTTICAYSLRAKQTPTVSTPVTWAEVEKTLKNGRAGDLSFTSDAVLARVAKSGDLFAPVLSQKQKWPRKLPAGR